MIPDSSHLTPAQAQATFQAELKALGHNYTGARREILEAVLARQDHFEADDLYSQMRAADSRVSRSTIYRTLEVLERLGIVSKVMLGHKHSHYENMVSRLHHDHLVCLHCERIVEFENDEIERIQESICREHGFELRSHALELYGICEKCQKQRSK